MAEHPNTVIVRRVIEEFFPNPTEALGAELFAPHVPYHMMWHNPVDSETGAALPDVIDSTPAGFVANNRAELARSPQRQIHIDHLAALDDGERVLLVRTEHTTSALGTPLAVQWITIARLADGRIVELWDTFDRLGYWQQLGVVPPTPVLHAELAAKQQTAPPQP